MEPTPSTVRVMRAPYHRTCHACAQTAASAKQQQQSRSSRKQGPVLLQQEVCIPPCHSPPPSHQCVLERLLQVPPDLVGEDRLLPPPTRRTRLSRLHHRLLHGNQSTPSPLPLIRVTGHRLREGQSRGLEASRRRLYVNLCKFYHRGGGWVVGEKTSCIPPVSIHARREGDVCLFGGD